MEEDEVATISLSLPNGLSSTANTLSAFLEPCSIDGEGIRRGPWLFYQSIGPWRSVRKLPKDLRNIIVSGSSYSDLFLAGSQTA